MEDEFFDEDEFLTREYENEEQEDSMGINERDATYLGENLVDDD